MRPHQIFSIYGSRRVAAHPTVPKAEVSLDDDGDVYELYLDDGSDMPYSIMTVRTPL